MATSSRQSVLFGVNDWKTIYKTFNEASFLNYDYETLRKSFIDYITLTYPETFNDYIESSEFIALMDVIAFMGQSLAFRNDLNTRENFIDTAERRDSVIKLANLVSYTPKRNLAGQGFLKVVSVKTTQNISDINGLNLSNSVIQWNDPANSSWQEQYNIIINAALTSAQRIGKPGNSQQLLGVKTDEYALSIPTTSLPVYPFSATIDGSQMRFELTSMSSVGQSYLYEIPPGPTSKFNILYRNDKLGYGSPNTGFFVYFKQGQLQTYNFTLAQQLANQVIPITGQGVNDSDTWLYQTINNVPTQWTQIDNIYSDAHLHTQSNVRKLFSVISGFNDQVSYTFGDGVLSDIPVGNFTSYTRSSNAMTYAIDPAEIQGITITIPYISRVGRSETISLGVELQLPVSNAQARESLANIKQRAPTKYYTQNRMVNGEDYNNFPYSIYSSIIKSKALNRSSVGVSRNLDLLDPSGKYSSINSFGQDGALYMDNSLGNLSLTIANVGDIVSFLSNTLATTLASNDVIQYYMQAYDRFAIDSGKIVDTQVYWKTQTVDASSLSGYFYDVDGPIPVGTYSSINMKYATKGSMLKFVPPPGYFFDKNNRLVLTTGSTFMWTTVLSVIGDGFNYGAGAFSNGTGPIVLNGHVPNGAIITEIIPAFDNTLPDSIIQECISRMELYGAFSLKFDNSLSPAVDRWSVADYVIDMSSGYYDTIVNFTSTPALNSYSVDFRALTYYFGSVAETRFLFETSKLVHDSSSGKTINDSVKVLSVNTQPSSNDALVKDTILSIMGQPTQSDGYVNDFEVEVSSFSTDNQTLFLDPDFFNTITGYEFGTTNNYYFVFFELLTDAINLSRYQIISSSLVVYTYPTLTEIEVVKYDYPVGQIFYAYSDNVFYTSSQDPAVQTPYFTLTVAPSYQVKTGRQGISFQYRHNSNNTTRIDPATTNIIDLYVVTQSYYTNYKNWIQDTTNTVSEPIKPTINELDAAYDKLQDYKMISDSIILNSVIFKPLFGPKADSALQATLKVIKSLSTSASDSEIRSATLSTINSYFDINSWNFGDTFYFSELSAYIHSQIGDLVNSVVLVPNDPTKSFGDLYEINAAPYEIFVNAATANDIVVITSLTSSELQIH